MKTVKILHCIQSLSWGGLELYTVELIRKLSSTSVEQYVLCSEHSRIAEELRQHNVTLMLYPQKKISKLTAARMVRKISREKNITHLHSHTRLDMWACALARWNSSNPKHVYNLYMNALPKQDLVHRWLFSKVDALCSSSEFVLAEAKKNFPIAPEKLHLVRYGRDTVAYVPAPEKRRALREQLHIQDNELVFGTLCRIDPGKGVREMIQALDHLSDQDIKKIHMVIVGEPTIESRDHDGTIVYEASSLELAQWIDTQAQSERLAGHLHRVPFQKEYIPVIDALDVFILASHNETYSLSVLDAMLMKKPVIGTHAGGTTEQVGSNQRGRLVPPKDPQALAKALRFYIENPQQAKAQGEVAKAWVLSQHNWAHTLKVTLALYEQMAEPL